jgi:hypothetical protein
MLAACRHRRPIDENLQVFYFSDEDGGTCLVIEYTGRRQSSVQSKANEGFA